MNIHEYQGKELLRRYGVATPAGHPCFSAAEAAEAAEELGGKVWIVKAQIHAGGRGKGGGVKLARSIDEVRKHAIGILGMTLVTHQTGPEGRLVKQLLVEKGADTKKELYLGMVVDRASQRVTLMASSEGGMDIEEVATHAPEKIHKVSIDPATGLTDREADDVARTIGVPESAMLHARTLMHGLYRAFDECDASLAEINPLVVTADDRVIALDAKLNFDSNALFRHPEIVALRDLDEEDPAEIEASKFDLAYSSLDGFGDLRATPLSRGRHPRGGGGGPRPRHLHHRRHSGARHDPHARAHARQEDDPARAELPRRHHARRDQDRHHAGPHPYAGPHRRGLAFGHAYL